MKKVIFAVLAASCLAKTHDHSKKHHKDEVSQILGDISKGADAAKEIEGLLGHHSGSQGNGEFDFGYDFGANVQFDKAGQIIDDVSKGVDVAQKIANLIKGLKGGKKSTTSHGSSGSGSGSGSSSGSGSGSQGNEEFDLEADNQLAKKKKQSAQDKISQILGDVSKGADVAKKIEGLFGNGSGSQGNGEFDLVADNQFAKKKKQSAQDKISQILGDVSKGADVAKKIEGLFGNGSGSQGNGEFDLFEDNQLGKKNHKKNNKKHNKKNHKKNHKKHNNPIIKNIIKIVEKSGHKSGHGGKSGHGSHSGNEEFAF